MHKLRFESFLGCHHKCTFHGSSKKTAHKVIGSAFAFKDLLLTILVTSKSNIVLWNGKQKESTISSIQPKHAALFHSLLDQRNGTHFVLVRIELHDSLCVLGGVGDRDLDSTGDAAYKFEL